MKHYLCTSALPSPNDINIDASESSSVSRIDILLLLAVNPQKYLRTKSQEAANHPGHWQRKQLCWTAECAALYFKKSHGRPKVLLSCNKLNAVSDERKSEKNNNEKTPYFSLTLVCGSHRAQEKLQEVICLLSPHKTFSRQRVQRVEAVWEQTLPQKEKAKSLIRAAKTDFSFFRAAGSQTQVFGFALHFAHQGADQTGSAELRPDEHNCKEMIHQATCAALPRRLTGEETRDLECARAAIPADAGSLCQRQGQGAAAMCT